MDEEIKTKYKDEIERERDRQPSFGENKRLQEIDKELRALHEKYPDKPGFATDILELLRDIISGIVTSVAPTTADIEARATDAATDYDLIAWEKTNLGAPDKPPSPSGGGKRRKTKKRRSKKRRSKKRRTKKRRSKKRRTSTRKTRRR
jgi:hypothetical protein